MTPSSLILRWSSPSHAGNADRTERWYGVPFSADVIAPSRLQRWTAAAAGGQSGEEASRPGGELLPLHLPAANPLIATDFALQPAAPAPPSHPLLLSSAGGLAVWHKQDTAFKKPKAQLAFTLISGRHVTAFLCGSTALSLPFLCSFAALSLPFLLVPQLFSLPLP